MKPEELNEELQNRINNLERGTVSNMSPYNVLQLALLQNILAVVATQANQLQAILMQLTPPKKEPIILSKEDAISKEQMEQL
jgi:hypothetical protein